MVATNQCCFSDGADNEAFLQADVIKQRWVSPRLILCGAPSATAQLEFLCCILYVNSSLSILCAYTDPVY